MQIVWIGSHVSRCGTQNSEQIKSKFILVLTRPKQMLECGKPGGSANFRPALTQATGVDPMSRADVHHNTNLSLLIRDPFVRAAFLAAERDGLAPLAVLNDAPPSLDGGEAVAFDCEIELV
jgi:hypothetical protein